MNLTLDILEKAIKEYRSEGTELMKRLGDKFDCDISIPEQYQKLISKSNPDIPRSGKLSERVNYAFHGGECGFHKRKTQQNVEVILSNAPTFGSLDAWFLKECMDSTDSYKKYSKDIQWLDFEPMLDELYRSGRITEIKRD